MEPPDTAASSRRVDFHVNVDDALLYACRVVRKARAGSQTVLVQCGDAERLARLDTALWTFSALDFLPHVRAGSPLAARTPVWLTLDPVPAGLDLLLRLDAEAPPGFEAWFGGFGRVIEVVSREAGERERARGRFRAYRERGLEPAVHDLGAAP